MGWLSGFRTRQEALEAEGISPGLFRGAWVGNHFWFIIPADKCDAGKPAIALALLERWGPGDWAIKVMDEGSGPYYYSCPRTLIEACPDPQVGYSTDWRERWAEAKRKPAASS